MGKGLDLVREVGDAFARSRGTPLELHGTANGADSVGEEPWHWHPIAWEYLLPDRPMTRRIDTLEVHSARWGRKVMELDVSFPKSCVMFDGDPDGPDERCMVPAALIPEEPVAVDLEVRDASDSLVSVPTRRECKELTERAMSLISKQAASLLERPRTDFFLDPSLQLRIGDVITRDPLRARISRLHVERKMGVDGAVGEWLFPLLRRLEDNYMLWVPIEGLPLGDHHLTVRRSERRRVDRIFPPARPFEENISVESRAGEISGRWRPASSWLYKASFTAAMGRLLVSFGLMPVKFDDESLEADRFSSYHVCMVPPAGLVVREVKAGGIRESEWGKSKPRIEEISTDLDRTVHGEDSRAGHVHFEMDRNPSWLNSRITIGLRPGTTTLWGAVVVLTCGLLWALHSEISRILAASGGGQERIDVQIAAAALLVVPTFAASWTLRLNDPTMIRNMLGGTRALLLSSAILSVSSALALASISPFGWDAERAVEWYASASYVIAVLIAIGWLQARSVVWIVYRKVLGSTAMNTLATVVLCVLSYAALHPLAGLAVLPAALLVLSGLTLTAVAANRTSVPLGENSRKTAALAGLGGLASLFLAGREIGFFEHVVANHDAVAYGGDFLLLTAVVSALAWLSIAIRSIVRFYREKGKEQLDLPSKESVGVSG